MRLTGRKVLITGGTGALGQAVTLAFLEAGARVFATGRAEAEREALLASAAAYRDRLHGTANLAAYSVSKAGVISLVQALAEELGEVNVQANCVLPGVIDTPANRRAMPDADVSRWVAPAEIARVILFLASDDSTAVSGAAVPVYGRS